MEARKSTGRYWLWFFIWFAIIVIMLFDVGGSRPYFWLALPGVVTYFAKAMDIM